MNNVEKAILAVIEGAIENDVFEIGGLIESVHGIFPVEITPEVRWLDDDSGLEVDLGDERYKITIRKIC